MALSGEPNIGSVQSDVPGISCGPNCSFDYVDGTSVTLTAVPADVDVHEFIAWQGDCSSSGSNPVATVSMTQGRSCTAQFGIKPYVYAGVIGDGRVTVPEAGLDCGEIEVTAECFTRVPTGTQVTFTAVPNSGATFVRWYVGCSGTNPAHPLTIDSDQRCVAEFVGGRRIFVSGFEAP